MAEQGKGGIFAKAQKQLTRTKTKVLQNLGKAGKTTDEAFDEHVQKLDRQQENAARFQKEFCKYLQCARDMVAATKSFHASITETYEPEWKGENEFKETLQSYELMWNDYVQKLHDQIDEPLKKYRTHFQPLKTKVAKRGRKLVYYDNAKHHLEVQQNAKKKDDAKIGKAEEELNDAKKIYETLNKDLHTELPEFYNSRINFYATTFNNLFNAESVFHTEVGRLCSSLNETTEDLAKDSAQLTYTPRRPLSINNSNDDSLLNDRYIESPTKLEPESPVTPVKSNGHQFSDDEQGIYENEIVENERRSNDIDVKVDSDSSSSEKTPKVSTEESQPKPDEPNIEPYHSNDLEMISDKPSDVKDDDNKVEVTLSSVVENYDDKHDKPSDVKGDDDKVEISLSSLVENYDDKHDKPSDVKGDDDKVEISLSSLVENYDDKHDEKKDSDNESDTGIAAAITEKLAEFDRDIKIEDKPEKMDDIKAELNNEVKAEIKTSNEVKTEISSNDEVKAEISVDKQTKIIDEKEPVPRNITNDTENEAPDYPAPRPPDSFATSEIESYEQKDSSDLSKESKGSSIGNKDDDDSDNSYDCPPIPVKVEENNNIDDHESPVYEVPPAPVPLKDPPADFLYKVQATHTYSCEDVDELSFETGEIIYIIKWVNPEEQDDGWQMGMRASDGKRGVFPENFTRRL